MSAEITPEAVVSDLFAAEDTLYDDSGNGWFVVVDGDGNVIKVTITPGDDEGMESDEPVHFRAVVVEGEEMPLVLEWPAELGMSWPDGGDLLALASDGIVFCPRGVDEWVMDPAEARELAAQLAAMADALDAANGGASNG